MNRLDSKGAFLLLLMVAFLAGCSCSDTTEAERVTESARDNGRGSPVSAATSPSNDLLNPESWFAATWPMGGFDNPAGADDISLTRLSQGLEITTLNAQGQIHVMLGRRLAENFEFTARVEYPSNSELVLEGIESPNPFGGMVGFRGEKNSLLYRTQLPRDKNRRESYDIVIRSSKSHLGVWVNSERSLLVNRSNLKDGHCFFDLPARSRIVISECNVREGVEPDPLLFAKSPNKSSPRMIMPGMIPPGMMPPGMPSGPAGYPGSGLPGFPVGRTELPAVPVFTRTLSSLDGWAVPATSNLGRDRSTPRDLRLESVKNGVRVTNSAPASGGWIVRHVEVSGDFSLEVRLTLPPFQQLTANPRTLLALGIQGGSSPGLTIPSPPPLPSVERDLKIVFKRSGNRAIITVDGTSAGTEVQINDPVALGFYSEGGLHFWLRDVTSDPPSIVDSSSATENATGPTPSDSAGSIADSIPRTRIWTERNGQRQIKATFLRLVEGQVHFQREDSREVVVSLEGLSITDQQVVRQLATRQEKRQAVREFP